MVSVTVKFALPDPLLRPYLSSYYECQFSGPVADYLHPEWANIRLSLDQPWVFELLGQGQVDAGNAIIHGPTSRQTLIKGGGGGMFGIGILPTGWNRLWKADASVFADTVQPLSALMGPEAEALLADLRAAPDLAARATIADAAMLRLLARSARTRFDDQVEALFQVLVDPASATVEQITGTLGLSQPQLSRLAKRGFGFPPKLLLRRQRFLRMLGTLHARPYDEWLDFLDPQYVDQSHMIRDFQRFLGMAPSRYFALERPILAAAAKGRAAFLGQPLQGLHHPKTGAR